MKRDRGGQRLTGGKARMGGFYLEKVVGIALRVGNISNGQMRKMKAERRFK